MPPAKSRAVLLKPPPLVIAKLVAETVPRLTKSATLSISTLLLAASTPLLATLNPELIAIFPTESICFVLIKSCSATKVALPLVVIDPSLVIFDLSESTAIPSSPCNNPPLSTKPSASSFSSLSEIISPLFATLPILDLIVILSADSKRPPSQFSTSSFTSISSKASEITLPKFVKPLPPTILR